MQRGGGLFKGSRLLAALAVLAVALVVLAAVPAAATDSDAEDASTSYTDGLIAAYLVSDSGDALSAYNALKTIRASANGSAWASGGSAPELYLLFSDDTAVTDVTVTFKYTNSSGTATTETETRTYDTNAEFVNNWETWSDYTGTDGVESKLTQDVDTISSITVTVSQAHSSGAATESTVTLVAGNIYIYQNVTLASATTIPDGVTLNVASGTTLTAAANLTVAGTLNVDGSLVQTKTSGESPAATTLSIETTRSIDGTGSIEIAAGNTLEIKGSATVPSGMTLTLDAATTSEGEAKATITGSLTIASGATLVVADSVSGATGNVYAAEVTGKVVNNGTIRVGTTDQKTTVVDPTSGSRTETAASVAELTNAGNAVVYGYVAEIDNSKNVRLYGTIAAGTNTGTISLESTNAEADVTGDGTVSVSDSIKKTVIFAAGSEISQATSYGAFQTIEVQGDTTIESVVYVQGAITVNSGVTLTIAEGGALVLAGSAASLTNNGTIAVESASVKLSDKTNGVPAGTYAGLQIGTEGEEGEGSLTNNGTIALDYETPEKGTVFANAVMAVYTAVQNNGTIAVGDESELTIDLAKKASFINAGTITIEGLVVADKNSKIVSSGKITVATDTELSAADTDGTAQTLYISLSSADATVDVQRFVGTVSIDDNAYRSSNKSYGSDSVVLTFVQTGADTGSNKAAETDAYAGGLTVGITTVSYKDGSSTLKDSALAISGSLTVTSPTVGAASMTSYATLALSDTEYAAVIGDLSIGKNVLATVSGTAIVDGAITIAAGGYLNAASNGLGTAILNKGSIASATRIDTDQTSAVASDVSGYALAFVGASYTTETEATSTTSASTVYHYTTINAALAAADGTAVKSVAVYGGAADDSNNGAAVSTTATVPSGVTVTVNKAIAIESGVTLTFAAGSKLSADTGAQISVSGKLVFENSKNNGTSDVIKAEVIATDGSSATYSSLTTALAEAGTAEKTITLQGETSIGADTTIPSNVTVDTNDQKVTVEEGYTLTIDGSLYLDGGSFTVTGDVVLNGYIRSADVLTAYKQSIDGAYYETGSAAYYWVTGISNAGAVIAGADNLTVEIHGDVATDLTLEGTDSDNRAIISISDAEKITGKIDAKYVALRINDGTVTGAISLSYSTLAIASGVVLNTTVSGANGAVSLSNATLASDASSTTVASASASSGTETLTLNGRIAAADTTKDAAIGITGDVLASNTGFSAGVTTVDGNLSLSGSSSRSNSTTLAYITVNGTLTVGEYSTLKATTVEVLGSATVADKSSSSGRAGALEVTGTLYVGTTQKAATGTAIGDAASLTAPAGAVSAANVVVAPGSTVSADALTDSSGNAFESAAYYVDNSLYTTVYAADLSTVKVNSVAYSSETSKFIGWYPTDGSTSDYIDPTSTTTISSDSYTAYINYNVYSVKVVTDAGVGTVTINGIILDNEGGNTFTGENLVAGTYTVTLTANSGWSTSAAKITDASGNTVSAITLSGAYADSAGEAIEYTYYITGSTQTSSGSVTPTPSEPTVIEKETDNGLTNILLIVLIVLAVVLAALVALRLMRS